MMSRRLSSTLHHPLQTVAQLNHEFQIVWNETIQEVIDHLFLTMSKHVEKYIQFRGRQIHLLFFICAYKLSKCFKNFNLQHSDDAQL